MEDIGEKKRKEEMKQLYFNFKTQIIKENLISHKQNDIKYQKFGQCFMHKTSAYHQKYSSTFAA